MDVALFARHKLLVEQHFEEEKKSPAHDFSHVERTLRNADLILKKEHADKEVVYYALLFSDYIREARHENEKGAPELSAVAAEAMLNGNLEKEKLQQILYCIKTHSRSSTERPGTLEAKVVWDADKLDGVGKIGIARWFMQAQEFGWSIESAAQKYITMVKGQIKKDQTFYTKTGRKYGEPKMYEALIICEDILKACKIKKA